MEKFKSKDIINIFNEIGTSDGNGNLEFEKDSYTHDCIKSCKHYFQLTIDINFLMEQDSFFKDYILNNELRNYFDEDGEEYNHEDEYHSLDDNLHIPPIIGYNDDNSLYVIDGFNRLLQNYRNENFEITIYLDERGIDLIPQENNFDFSR